MLVGSVGEGVYEEAEELVVTFKIRTSLDDPGSYVTYEMPLIYGEE